MQTISKFTDLRVFFNQFFADFVRRQSPTQWFRHFSQYFSRRFFESSDIIALVWDEFKLKFIEKHFLQSLTNRFSAFLDSRQKSLNFCSIISGEPFSLFSSLLINLLITPTHTFKQIMFYH
jgi:hypothetical protein